MQSFLRTYADGDLQQPMEAAVVIPTILRPVLKPALESVYAQQFSGRIHVLIGIDSIGGDLNMLDAVCRARPSHVAIQVYWAGYSTSTRHGGLTPPGDGGALRCVLTYMANSPYVAYLDDDNWWAPQHLALMRKAIEDVDWAFALRWFVHPITRRPVAVDIWESVGPGMGVFADSFGGFVDPSCLMFNKVKCPRAAVNWNFPLRDDPMSADRSVFNHLSKGHKARGTGRPTVFYALNLKDGLHARRVLRMQEAYDQAGAEAVA